MYCCPAISLQEIGKQNDAIEVAQDADIQLAMVNGSRLTDGNSKRRRRSAEV